MYAHIFIVIGLQYKHYCHVLVVENSMAEKEEFSSEKPDEKPKSSCGFCRRGADVNDVCGKLWHDPEKACTAHQRCMV
jgi:hypothetical protein